MYVKNIVILIALLFCFSCTSEEQNTKELVRFTFKGTTYEWSQDDPKSDPKEFVIAYPQQTFIIFAGNTEQDNEILIFVRTDGNKPQKGRRYEFLTTTVLDNSLPQVLSNINLGTKGYTSLYQTEEKQNIGTIIFEEISQSSCSGRFNFEVYDEGQTLEVTNGFFNVPIRQ